MNKSESIWDKTTKHVARSLMIFSQSRNFLNGKQTC